jgi:hypothetical protein
MSNDEALQSADPSSSGSFVLDEGFEQDDEEVLAFEASRSVSKSATAPYAVKEAGSESEARASELKAESAANDPPPHPDALLIDNIPKEANRNHVEALLGDGVEILALMIHRFPNKMMAARVQLANDSVAAAIVQRYSVSLGVDAEDQVSIKYAPCDWDVFLESHPYKAFVTESPVQPRDGIAVSSVAPRGNVMIGPVPVNLVDALPDAEEVKSAFWGAVARTQKAAEAIDQRVRAAGTDIDSQYNVVEQLDSASKRSRAILAEADAKYKVSDALTSAVKTGRTRVSEAAEVAGAVDDAYGVSRRLSEVTTKLTRAGSIAAREVDENLQLSERSRRVANSALESEQIGPVVKGTVSQLGSLWLSLTQAAGVECSGAARKKERPPQGIEQDTMNDMLPEKVEMSAILGDDTDGNRGIAYTSGVYPSSPAGADDGDVL